MPGECPSGNIKQKDQLHKAKYYWKQNKGDIKQVSLVTAFTFHIIYEDTNRIQLFA